tara:strand:+ start:144 stop:650 length:507 start_codon:yes stop_codon:yes gene_type:complete
MRLDLLNNDPFNSSTPGQSLTDTPGKWQWEQPQQIIDPEEAFERVLASLQDPITLETVSKLMYIGVSIESILNGIMLKMFGEGMFSPDVAEIIKPLLARYLLKVANDNGITVNIINKFPKPPLSDGDTINLLKQFNPKEYAKIAEKVQDKEDEVMTMKQQGFMDKGGE